MEHGLENSSRAFNLKFNYEVKTFLLAKRLGKDK
jgi:hypothetical protein